MTASDMTRAADKPSAQSLQQLKAWAAGLPRIVAYGDEVRPHHDDCCAPRTGRQSDCTCPHLTSNVK